MVAPEVIGCRRSSLALSGCGPAASPVFESRFQCCESRELYLARRRWFQERARLPQDLDGVARLQRCAGEAGPAKRPSCRPAARSFDGLDSDLAAYRLRREWYAQQVRMQRPSECMPSAAALMSGSATPSSKERSDTPGTRAWIELGRACSVMVLGLSAWFASNSFKAEISQEYELEDLPAAILTASVNLGFMVAATASAILQLQERFSSKHLSMTGLVIVAVTNAVFTARLRVGALFPLRLMTGMGISLIYPTLVRYVAGWFQSAFRGFALGCTIGSLTLGIAAPSLLRVVLPSANWRAVTLTTSGCAVLAVVLASGMRTGPHVQAASSFSAKNITKVMFDRNWCLVTLSYVGHNFELFGGWSSLGDFVHASGAAHTASVASLGIIGVGVLGAILGGYLADRIGRRALVALCHIVSGVALLVLPTLRQSGAPPFVVVGVAGLWGMASIADSAQYSAMIADVLEDKALLGTAVTLSLSLGFSSTAAGIFVVPALRGAAAAGAGGGWSLTLPVLALGPAFGIIALFGVNTGSRCGLISQRHAAPKPWTSWVPRRLIAPGAREHWHPRLDKV